MNVLIKLHKGYGLGDCVQMSAVLQHVAKHRPAWVVDYQAEEGRHQVGRGIVANTFAYGDPHPHVHYNAEVLVCLYDTFAHWGDRPCTRVSSCLHEQFGIGWDRECGRYKVSVSDGSLSCVRSLLFPVSKRPVPDAKLVGVHYQGDSSPDKKNLTHKQADLICKHIEDLDHIPVILDWRDKCPLDYRRITAPREGGNDAEMVTAIISQMRAFVGIDSGPSKCASATKTPTLVTWTGHHPAQFHDPAPNTTHLVPEGYHGLHPICNDAGVIKWFEENYHVRQYRGDPVEEIRKWLTGVLTA